MQAGTVAVAGYAEAVIDGQIDVAGYGPITLHTREGQQLGTIAKTTSAAYTSCTSAWTPLILPVDFVP